MSTSLIMTLGFEALVQDNLLVLLQDGQVNNCYTKNIKLTIKSIKCLKRRLERFGRFHPRQARFCRHASSVLKVLLEDLYLAYRYFKSGEIEEAYRYIQWARIRAYDIRHRARI